MPRTPKIGRPPEMGRRRNDWIKLRALTAEVDAWRKAARAAGKGLSAWVRDVLNRAAGRTVE